MTIPIDTAEYELIRAPVLDEFVYDRDGITIPVNRAFLTQVCDNHNAAAKNTGSLSQIVVGHTIDNAPEHDQPQSVGVLHNWAVEPWVNDAGVHTTAAFADHYIKKVNDLTLNGAVIRLSAKALLERFPRRSGEVWWGSKTVDPHCLLGATAPERNLGLLRLSKNGTSDFALTYHSPGKLSKMPDAIQTAADLPIVKTLEETVAQLANIMEGAQSLLGQLQQLQQPQGQELQGGGQDDIEQLLQSLGVQGGGQGGGEQEPEPAPLQPAKMHKEENDELRARLARVESELNVSKLSKKVSKLKDEEGVLVDPNDDTLLKDLACMPEEVQDRMLARFAKGAERIPGQIGANLQRAINSGAPKKIGSAEETQTVAKLAREKGTDFASAAKELGYTL